MKKIYIIPIILVLFCSIPFLLWDIENIHSNFTVNKNELIIIKSHKKLWALNNHPKIIIVGDLECKVGSNIQLSITAQLVFPNNQTYQYGSELEKICIKKIERIQVNLKPSFDKLPLFNRFNVLKIHSSYTLKNVSITWYNASP